MTWERMAFTLMVLGQLDIHMGEKINLEPYLTSNTKIESRWFVDLNMKEKPKEHLNENIDYLHDFGIGKD